MIPSFKHLNSNDNIISSIECIGSYQQTDSEIKTSISPVKEYQKGNKMQQDMFLHNMQIRKSELLAFSPFSPKNQEEIEEENSESHDLFESGDEDEKDEVNDFVPRPKANTFTSGCISLNIPAEKKASAFGGRFKIQIDSFYNGSSNSIGDQDTSIDSDSVDCAQTTKHGKEQTSFRSSFFKKFKTESLRLITLSKEENPMPVRREQFEENFVMGDKIGEGCHSVVRKCSKKGDSPYIYYAVKIIAYKDQEYLFEIIQEERILSQLKHKNIIKYDCFFLEKEKKKAYIVSEFARGKTLATYFHGSKFFELRTVRTIAKQMLKGVMYMHSKGIIHRDLSFNNVMFDLDSETIKIIDFTVSKIVTIQKLMTNTGTLQFKSPEMLSGQLYSHSIDLWAIGINLFAIIFGYLPFDDSSDNQKTIIHNIINFDPFSSIKSESQTDPLLIHFLEGLLEKDPSKRMTALQATKHPWMNQKITKEDLKARRARLSKNKTISEIDESDYKQQYKMYSSHKGFVMKNNLQNIKKE